MKRKYRKAQLSFGRTDDDLHMIFTHHTKQSTLVKFADKPHHLNLHGQLWTSDDGITYTIIKSVETEQSALTTT